MMYSPIHIDFAMACHCSTDPRSVIGPDRWESSAGKSVRAWLLSEGLIDENEDGTDRLDAWVGHLCSQSLPTRRWVVENTDAE